MYLLTGKPLFANARDCRAWSLEHMPDLGEQIRDAHGLLVMWVACPSCPERRWVRLTKYDRRAVRVCARCNRDRMRRGDKVGKAYN